MLTSLTSSESVDASLCVPQVNFHDEELSVAREPQIKKTLDRMGRFLRNGRTINTDLQPSQSASKMLTRLHKEKGQLMTPQLIVSIANDLANLPGRSIVAVDGVDGAGKTIFANALGQRLEALGRPVIRAGIDGFHNPRSVRYRLGKNSPKGFFLDSFNYDSVKKDLLAPFRSGALTVQTVRFDSKTDREVANMHRSSPEEALLVFDGIFLHRPELDGFWERSIFLDVPFPITFGRLARRDGMNPDPAATENRRYVDGENIYLRTCQPRTQATYLIDNSEFDAPKLMNYAPSGTSAFGM
jgi:uridine kinase